MRLLPLLALLLIALGLTAGPPAWTMEPAPTTPEAMLRHVEERFRSLSDYQCRASLESRLGDRRETGEYRIYVKLPRMVRVHVERGRSRGSDVVMARDGSIRGRKGGILKPFVIRLDPDDKRLLSLRGGLVTDFDWGSFYRKMREHAALPGARLTLARRSEEATAHYEVVVTYPSGGKQYREIMRIDPSLWAMVEGHVYEENVPVDHVRFYDIRLNTGLTDNFFRL